MGTAMLAAALAIVTVMLTTWIISVLIKNASIVDITWGFGFVVVAWTVRLTVEGDTARQNLLVALVTLWGLRLALYLAKRNLGHGEDFRYVLMRRKHGAKFPWVSLYTVFGLQGALMWAVSLPIQLGQADDGVSVGPVAMTTWTFRPPWANLSIRGTQASSSPRRYSWRGRATAPLTWWCRPTAGPPSPRPSPSRARVMWCSSPARGMSRGRRPRGS